MLVDFVCVFQKQGSNSAYKWEAILGNSSTIYDIMYYKVGKLYWMVFKFIMPTLCRLGKEHHQILGQFILHRLPFLKTKINTNTYKLSPSTVFRSWAKVGLTKRVGALCSFALWRCTGDRISCSGLCYPFSEKFQMVCTMLQACSIYSLSWMQETLLLDSTHLAADSC